MPGSSVEIYPATWRDLRGLRHLEQVCFGEDAWPLLDLIAILSVPGVVRYKAVIEGRMVGFIAGQKRSSRDLAWIATFGVLPDFRRRGIGSRLLNTCEQMLEVSCIRLNVRIGNEPALQLYQQQGYHRVEIWPSYYKDGTDALVLEKKLENTL